MTMSSKTFNPPTLFAAPSPAMPPAVVPAEIALCELLPHNQRLVRFILERQPISVANLYAAYDDTGASLSAFMARLGYLKGKRWLVRTGEGQSALLTFNNDRQAKPARVIHAAPAVPVVTRTAPPRRNSVMAGTYQPAPPAAKRPGSDDYTRLPSLRHGQRVDFTPGYIFY